MKAGGSSKADVAPEVSALLALKQQLAVAQGAPAALQSNKKSKPSAPKVEAVTQVNGTPAKVDQAEVDRLQALVTEQVSCSDTGNVMLADCGITQQLVPLTPDSEALSMKCYITLFLLLIAFSNTN